MTIDVQTLRTFFMWYTILSGAIYTYTAIMCICARGFIYGMQSKLFPMSEETHRLCLYGYLGVFKIVFIVFSLVPFLALVIMT